MLSSATQLRAIAEKIQKHKTKQQCMSWETLRRQRSNWKLSYLHLLNCPLVSTQKNSTFKMPCRSSMHAIMHEVLHSVNGLCSFIICDCVDFFFYFSLYIYFKIFFNLNLHLKSFFLFVCLFTKQNADCSSLHAAPCPETPQTQICGLIWKVWCGKKGKL